MEKGKIAHSSLFLARILGGQIDTRIAAVAPQKIFKKAVIRNKIRRSVYEVLRNIQKAPNNPTMIKGVHVLVLAKSPLLKSDRTEIETDLKTLFVKAGIMR